MLDYVVILASSVVILLAVMAYLFPRSKRTTTIPGPDVTHPVEGNLTEMAASGSLHEYLRDLHRTYGPITAFWLGPTFCVSVSSPEFLKELSNTFDRPKELYTLLEPLLTKYSIQYTNGVEARRRHTAYSRCFSHEALQKRYQIIQKYSAEFCTKWASLPAEEHIPISEHMFLFTIKSILGVAFGGYFSDTQEVLKFKSAYDFVWLEMESRLFGDAPDAHREKKFEESITLAKGMLRNAIKHSKDNDLDRDMFVQVVQEVNESPDVIDADMISVCTGGFHTTGLLLTWCVYFLATNQDVQDKLFSEVTDLVGDEEIPFEAINRMEYLKQVLEETLRCATIGPIASRVQNTDMVLGGHRIPAGTPVIQALGVIFENEKLWPEPNKFDPERFNAENRRSIPSCGFEPFGFAGKRRCPGYRLSYLEASLLLADLVRRFRIKMVEGQVVKPVYGLVTRPNEEIWVTLEKRK